ncbi:hypothetical protein BJV74DRAFT_799763 [Russula compacta]|nr:hypothetical protein BJV74DRAFT_799763 [Russula compacta]
MGDISTEASRASEFIRHYQYSYDLHWLVGDMTVADVNSKDIRATGTVVLGRGAYLKLRLLVGAVNHAGRATPVMMHMMTDVVATELVAANLWDGTDARPYDWSENTIPSVCVNTFFYMHKEYTLVTVFKDDFYMPNTSVVITQTEMQLDESGFV